ncbi:hypothetical protein O181_077528 [Austropuccinia psidii MF-1]|uniref:Tf2-1-like SH3-like domain-containing protein n=1 Tax=Austropuccinia psidii MF-1 TaxID=1389203 RepID=A0A9Q3FCZ1_9BASI|nr:hypothetical protein [Austropuccinia psidii MF-1]
MNTTNRHLLRWQIAIKEYKCNSKNVYKEGKSHTNEDGPSIWPLENVKCNKDYDPEVSAKIPTPFMEIDGRKNFRFSEWEPGSVSPDNGLVERMIQTMEDIIRRLCAYGMECKYPERYTLYWVPLLPEVQLAYNTSQHSTTGKSPSLVEKGWNPLLPVDHLKKNLLTIHATAKDFIDMWKRACDKASKCTAEAKEYKKQKFDKTHMEPEFYKGDQVVVSTHNFNNLKGPRKMRDSFVGPFTIINLIGKNAVEVRLTEEFSRKHPIFPLSVIKPYFQTGEDKFPFSNKAHTPQDIVEVEDTPDPVSKIIKARKIRLNGKN